MMTPKRLTSEIERRLDGPHADEHTADAADLAAEAIRYLNYATGSHSPAGLVFPATVYLIAGRLGMAADRMPQLFDQLSHWLAAEDAAGHLGMDDHSPAAAAVADAAARLAVAAALARQLGDALNGVQSALSAVNGRGPKRPERAS
jgi:hypothetical protein